MFFCVSVLVFPAGGQPVFGQSSVCGKQNCYRNRLQNYKKFLNPPKIRTFCNCLSPSNDTCPRLPRHVCQRDRTVCAACAEFNKKSLLDYRAKHASSILQAKCEQCPVLTICRILVVCVCLLFIVLRFVVLECFIVLEFVECYFSSCLLCPVFAVSFGLCDILSVDEYLV